MTAPYRLRPPDPYELDVQAECVKTLTQLLLPPAFFFSAAIGAVKLSHQQAAALSRAGVKRGLPDIMLIYDGRIFGLELKRRGMKLSKTRIGRSSRGAPRVLEGQEDVFPKLLAAGFAAIGVVHSVYEMIEQLANWQMPLRPGPYLSQFNLKSAQPMQLGDERGLNG